MPKKVRIELDFDIGDTVYLKTDPDLYPRIVVEIKLLPNDLAVYLVSCNGETTDHYGFELLDKKPIE